MSPQERAREIIDTLTANGAVFSYQLPRNSLPATFTYTLARGGDLWRCRALILDAKAEPEVWREVVAEIGARSNGRVSSW